MFEIDLNSFIFKTLRQASFYIVKRIFYDKDFKNIKLELLLYIMKVDLLVI